MFIASVVNPNATYNLTASTAAINEGSQILLTLETSGVQAGHHVPFTISGTNITAADFVPAGLTGYFVVDRSGVSTVSLTLATDTKTEGAESFAVTLHNGAGSLSVDTAINDTSVYSQPSHYNNKLYGYAPSEEFGLTMSLYGNYLAVSATGYSEGRGRVHLFNTSNWSLIRTINNPSAQLYEGFGGVLIWGNYLFVTQHKESDTVLQSGRVYVFNVSTGALIRYINNPAPAEYDRFGSDITCDGTYLVIAASDNDEKRGAVYVYNMSFTLLRTIYNPWSSTRGQYFGKQVKLTNDGCILITQGRFTNQIYKFNASTGTHVSSYTDPAGNTSGFAQQRIAVDGNNVIVGSTVSNNVYVYDHTTNETICTLTNPEPYYGPTANDPEGERFGWGVDINGKYAVVGVPNYQLAGDGAAYWFDITTGTKIAKVVNNSGIDNYGALGSNQIDGFGTTVILTDTVTLVAAPMEERYPRVYQDSPGAVWIFTV